MSERVPRLQTELEAAILTAGNAPDADCLKADLAAQFARGNHLDKAEAMLTELRKRYRAMPHERVTPWINFAEATLDLNQGRGDDALMKMRRAHALSAALGLPLRSFAASSLAHIYWNRHDVDNAVHYAQEALDLVNRDEHRTLCRASMVVGEIMALSRLENEARPWLIRARRHAMTSGDDLAVSALALNLSIIQLAVLRQTMFECHSVEADIKSVKSIEQSSVEIDAIFQIPERDMNLIHRAMLFSISGEYERAVAAYEAKLDNSRIASAPRQRAHWLADLSWCLVNIQQLDKARRLAIESAGAMTSDHADR